MPLISKYAITRLVVQLTRYSGSVFIGIQFNEPSLQLISTHSRWTHKDEGSMNVVTRVELTNLLVGRDFLSIVVIVLCEVIRDLFRYLRVLNVRQGHPTNRIRKLTGGAFNYIHGTVQQHNSQKINNFKQNREIRIQLRNM